MTSRFIDNLKALNRKERYHLLRFATGKGFQLDDNFRNALPRKISFPDSCEPEFVAMDYHLDWLSACACMELRDKTKTVAYWASKEKGDEFSNGTGPFTINGNQQDIDFLIAYRQDKYTHLIMLEAKFDTGWTTAQVNSKAQRLKQIFGSDGYKIPGVKPVFCITGLSQTIPNFCEEEAKLWPDWFFHEGREKSIENLHYIQLPNSQDLYRPKRINPKIEPVPESESEVKTSYKNWVIERAAKKNVS